MHKKAVGYRSFLLLQSKKEGGHADAYNIYQSHLEGGEGIILSQKHENNNKHHGVNGLCQVKGAYALDICYDLAAFLYDVLHGCKIRIQQHDVGSLFCRI